MTSKVLNLEGNLPCHTVKLIQTAKSWGQRELEPASSGQELGTRHFAPWDLEEFSTTVP